MTIAGVYKIIFDKKKQERKIERIDAVFVIQDDDAIFEIIFKRDWSPKVTEQSVT